MIQKFCNGCKETKQLSDFYFHKSGKKIGKPMSKCKKCQHGLCASWKERNPNYPIEWSHSTGRSMSYKESKHCSQYLGVHIAENILSKFFDGIKKMPIGNPGYDFICKKGYKIDVKSSCLRHRKDRDFKFWFFNIRRNQVADYFLCLAFDDRDNLNPQHIWLVPGYETRSKTSIQINNTGTSLHRWSEYEKPLDRVLTCCNTMKGIQEASKCES